MKLKKIKKEEVLKMQGYFEGWNHAIEAVRLECYIAFSTFFLEDRLANSIKALEKVIKGYKDGCYTREEYYILIDSIKFYALKYSNKIKKEKKIKVPNKLYQIWIMDKYGSV